MTDAARLLAVIATAAVQLVVCTDDAAPINNSNIPHEKASTEAIWLYKCIPEQGCHRVSKPLPTGNSSQTLAFFYENLDICRMSCGRFGGLWPRPSTAALSSQTVPIHPNHLRYFQIVFGMVGPKYRVPRGGALGWVSQVLACLRHGTGPLLRLTNSGLRFDLIDSPPETRELLAEMTQVLTANLVAECGGHVTASDGKLLFLPSVLVYINVKSNGLTLNWETDESYILDLQSKANDVITIHIVAETVFGARHGLETLSQLVSANRSQTRDKKECGLQILAGAKIKDKPIYPHRGLVLDTSRNFIPVDDIKRTIDGMAASKMNVLHWHATDTHSFPLESTRAPLLTKYGAYSSSEVYSVDEIKDLLKYGRARGVRVVLEIDSPAHAGNGWQWGKEYGMGDLAVCVNAQPWRALCIQPPCGQLNPANPHVYTVLRDLYKDIIELWPQGELFHMGGDEVFVNCWNSTEEIVSYMKNKGFDRTPEGFIRMWAEFHAIILGIWDDENKVAGASSNVPRNSSKVPVMLWSSELTQPNKIQNFLNKDRYVIEVWEPQGSPLLDQLMRLGYRVISSPKDVWYLDHGFWGITKYANWRRMYVHQIPRQPNVLGGEVAMWSEYVDGNALDDRIWPRAAAVAERLWADPSTSAAAAEPRMQRHRARLVARGIRADVLSPMWCTQHDMRCL